MRSVVTGGAGFIGSNLVEALLERGDDVVVVDDLNTGFKENLDPRADFREGSINDEVLIRDAVEGADRVFHLAAHGGVFRSVQHPLASDEANTRGTLSVLEATRHAGVERFMCASSSSVYGGADVTPTPEDAPLRPRSPYAVTKLVGEQYSRVYAELFGMNTVTLRFFNVFGPRQRPDSQYAAVIPLFIDALRSGTSPVVHGDGGQSRDFTFVADVVRAIIASTEAPADVCRGKVYNIACNAEYTLLDLLENLGTLLGVDPNPTFVDPRPGDIRHSRALVERAAEDLGWRAEFTFAEGLRRTVDWFTTR